MGEPWHPVNIPGFVKPRKFGQNDYLALGVLLFSLSPSKLFFFNPGNSISPVEVSEAAPNGPHLSQISLLTPQFSEPIPNQGQ